MNKAFFSGLLAIAATAAAGCGARSAPQPAPMAKTPAKPNIIFVLADDMGYADLQSYGGQGVQTPNVDRLAREGIRFTQFYVNSPICSPSRTAFTTGQYPARWNITSYIDNRELNQRRGMAQWLDLSAPTVARSLSSAGYECGHFGKWHMGGGRDVGEAPLPTEYGFAQSLTQFEGLGPRVLPMMSAQNGKPAFKNGLGVSSEQLGRGKISWVPRADVTSAFVDGALGFIENAEKRANRSTSTCGPTMCIRRSTRRKICAVTAANARCIAASFPTWTPNWGRSSIKSATIRNCATTL